MRQGFAFAHLQLIDYTPSVQFFMAQRQIMLRRHHIPGGGTLPLRIHSQSSGTKQTQVLSPIKLKTQNNKNLKSNKHHLVFDKEEASNNQEMLSKGKQLFSQYQFEDAIHIFKVLLGTSYQIQSLYYLGCSFLYRQKFQHAIYYLNLLLQKQTQFNQNSFILLAAAYKQLKLYKAAIKTLKKCITVYDKFQEAIIYLAKLYMKMRQFDSALTLLQSHNTQNASIVFRLTYADCLRLNHKLQQSVKQYSLVCLDSNLRLVGLLKRLTANYQLKQYGQSLADCNKLLQNKVESSEVYYFKGMNLIVLKPEEDFPVQFSKSVDLNNHPLAVTRSLSEIITNEIKKKDIYAAQSYAKRIQYLSIREDQIKCLLLFVQGAMDCVKKRCSDAILKLMQVQKCLISKKMSYEKVIEEYINIYLGYAYFLSSEYQKAIKCYELQTTLSDSTKYNKLICEGIAHHQLKDFTKCNNKMNQAKTLIAHFEPYFYLAINFVQQYFVKYEDEFLLKAIIELEEGLEIINVPSLYYFYLTLVLIQAKKPAEEAIVAAIQKSDDNVADYYFIRGIIESQHDFSIALNDFDLAISILKIPAYYKERSKCYYQLGMYSQAIEDLLKVLNAQKDYETSILLAFNYYVNEEYELSMRTLEEANVQEQNQYILGLKITLQIHLRNYEKAGTLGQIILSMQNNSKITDQSILQKFIAILGQKCAIGQFDIVQLLCLAGVYHFVHTQYQKSLEYFYDALNELKKQLIKQSAIDFGTQAKIYQSKFNIALTHLMMKEYEDSKKLLTVLIEETQSEITVLELKKLLDFVEVQLNKNIKMGIQDHEAVIDIFPNYKLLSQNFQSVKIRFKNAILVIKPILFYPQKLKFNIFPELNSKFLKDFGMYKVQNNPQPPWVIREGNYFKFTNEIDINSPTIEYTETNYQPQSSIEASHREERKDRYSDLTKQKLKLPDKINQKLQKIINNVKQ